MSFSILVTCPKGLEYLLQDELIALGLKETKVSPQGVYGRAKLSLIYEISLWSRIANRVLLIILQGAAAPDPQALHALCYQVPWQKYFQFPTRLNIHFQGMSPSIRSTMFGAQLIKDAIVDYARDHSLARPEIDRDKPQTSLRAYLHNEQLMLGLDLIGYSLHQRGYRLSAGEAPLKENLAAAILVRAKYSKDTPALYDPMCGSGTLLIEAAMMAANKAPGLLREDQAFVYWLGHDPKAWAAARANARRQACPPSTRFYGRDEDAHMIAMASDNAYRAGVGDAIDWAQQALELAIAPTATGLMVTNPPYGERLSDVDTLQPLYQNLGQRLHQGFPGWQAAVLTPSQDLAKAIGLRAHKHYTFYNGPLHCQLYCFNLDAANRLRGSQPSSSASTEMLANRLQKNLSHRQKWAKRQGIDAYRLYDADLPEYAFAIDLYLDYAMVQEYAAPASIPELLAAQRRAEMLSLLPGILNIPKQHLVFKQRMRQRGQNQYEKLALESQCLTITEPNVRLLVNLWDYLDSGLFLDHRLLRQRFGQLPAGTRFLNCFCYTASASVHAAAAGAITTNVDLSKTYLAWAEDNFLLNGLDLKAHRFLHEDCMTWLKQSDDCFDVIFLDPPSFSNSKRMEGVLDVARDHTMLINDAMRLLSPNGILYFSSNLRQFKLDPSLSQRFKVKDINSQTLDLDFKRNPKIHVCYTFQHETG